MKRSKVILLLLGVLLITALLVAGCGGQSAEQPKENEQQQAEQQEAQQPEEQAQEPEQQAQEEQAQQPEEQAQQTEEQKQQQEQQASGEEKEEFKYVSSDEKADGCVSCHRKVSEEKDYSLTAEMAAMNKEFGHPNMPIEGPEQCATCHREGDNSLDKVLHKAHLLGEENHFLTNYEGSCVQCHALTTDNQIVVKGLAKDVELQVIKSASVDLGKENCTSCHRKISDEKDYSLTAEMVAMNKEFGHPNMPIESAEQCATCHTEGDNSLDKVLHKAHLTGEENHFVSNYGGSCRNCHAIADTGEITAKL